MQKWKMFNPTTFRHHQNRNNRVLKSYCRNKRYKETLSLFSLMFLSEKPDLYSIPVALKACAGLKALEFGKAIHGFSKKNGQIGSNLFVGSALMDMYAKCGAMDESLRVFEEYSEPDTVLWTTVVTGFEQNGRSVEALECFARMAMAKGVVIDDVALVGVLSACVRLLDLKAGKSIHGYMIRVGLRRDLNLSNALLNLYEKTGSVDSAARLFGEMEERDVISWGSMIACYAHHGGAEEALGLFDAMVAGGIEPNAVVLISALQACEATCRLDEGRRIRELAARNGLDADFLVSTALISMYMSCSAPDEAAEVFQRMPEKDAVCFSAMLHGCVQNERACESIGVLRAMLAKNFRLDAFDVVKILTACSELGVLQQTSCFHGFVIRCGLGDDSFVCASLIESYAKCGSLDGAIAVFGQVKDRDVVMWSSMLAAYGIHGRGREALDLFDEMIKNSGVMPNEVSFLSILSACSHAGLIQEGIHMFNMMVKGYKITPNLKHCGIVVDLLGRVGEVEKAMGFISGMADCGDAGVWGALLGSCRVHRNREIAEIVGKKLVELDASDAGYYVLLSNMYAADEKWGEVARVRGLFEEKRLKKVSGRSVIEVRDEVCSFVANDRYHQDSKQIYGFLGILHSMMREKFDVFGVEMDSVA
ncbi:putative pentatricopeptide repeat-containing protein At3g01580 [Salvia miltiorrhiza]|uniref:putative pentatricopeptide repeat-containing protein At3g01580 n=1 Tax=Salvia miltiorrhiza TaxID=226208 RepID=UPI0025AC740A|nr:putative pentatricopeptide repeat-containing protein At3g01580 [Salvia miltiorrhiza]